jgi:glucose dehydrogenase
MPSFKGKLSETQMDDVIAWLVSLGGTSDVAQNRPVGGHRVDCEAQVSAERLRDSAREPQNWLTYNGSYASTHHSTLNQLRPDNVAASN